MKMLSKVMFAALTSAGALALMSGSASARIVCNDEGECWHVQHDYVYSPGLHLSIHPDNWRWKEGEHYTWREHEGKGYWKGHEWKEF